MATRGAGARRKGAQFERDIAKRLSDVTGQTWKRGLGQARDGGTEHSDVYCDDIPIHLELKNQKRCDIKKAMLQALEDRKTDTIPVVITKDTGKDTLVTIRLEDFLPVFDLWVKELVKDSEHQG